jgi:hypothetical protein
MQAYRKLTELLDPGRLDGDVWTSAGMLKAGFPWQTPFSKGTFVRHRIQPPLVLSFLAEPPAFPAYPFPNGNVRGRRGDPPSPLCAELTETFFSDLGPLPVFFSIPGAGLLGAAGMKIETAARAGGAAPG